MNETFHQLQMVLAGDRQARRRIIVDLAVMTATDVIVLYAMLSAIARRAAGEFALRELLLFALAAATSSNQYRKLLDHATLAFNGAAQAASVRILDAVHQADLTAMESIGEPAVLMRLSEDARRVAHAGAVVIMTIKAGLMVVATTALCAVLFSPVISAVGFGLMALCAYVLKHQGSDMSAPLARIAEIQKRLRELTHGLLRGFKQVKLHQRRRAEIMADYKGFANQIRGESAAFHDRYYAMDSLARTAFFLLLGINAVAIPAVWPSEAKTVADLNLAIIYVSRAMSLIVGSLPELAAIGACFVRLGELERSLGALAPSTAVIPGAADEHPPPPPALAAPESLSLRGVVFRHRGPTPFSLGPLDLTVRRGEIVFITGSNGSGKSTFFKLLTGLYRPTDGHIEVDGVRVDDRLLPSYRALFAAIFSDVEIFQRLYGITDAPPGRVQGLLAEMELDEHVTFDGGRFSTIDLSTGQRMRLAMVVALLHDRPIYVFDEWAADQDPEFREYFYRSILSALKARGKTVLAVTHDDHYFSVADRRIELAHGQVVTR